MGKLIDNIFTSSHLTSFFPFANWFSFAIDCCRDVVIPKSETRTSTSRSLEDDEDDEIDEDDYEDEDVQDSGIGGAGDFSINLNEENNVDGDLGLEFYDLDSGDDSIKKMKETTSTTSTTTSTTTTPRSAVLK